MNQDFLSQLLAQSLDVPSPIRSEGIYIMKTAVPQKHPLVNIHAGALIYTCLVNPPHNKTILTGELPGDSLHRSTTEAELEGPVLKEKQGILSV